MEMNVLEQLSMIDEAHTICDALLEAQHTVEEATLGAQQEAIDHLAENLGIASTSPAASDRIDGNIESEEAAILPLHIERALPLEEDSEASITTRLARSAIGDILVGDDDRLIVIVGPCSIHNAEEAVEYAEKVAAWREEYGNELEIVMRVYFEKPRSEVGWKGLAYDPNLDGSHDINVGLILSRITALRITGKGVPVAMERLHALTPLYLEGLVAYDAIGARNVTDQTAREYASGTSSPVGLKNAPDGSIDDAISAVVATRESHTFLGMRKDGMPSRIKTTGNKLAHIILRGGKNGPNYHPADIAEAKDKLTAKSDALGEELPQAVVVDASHANSGKKAANQCLVVKSLAEQIAAGEKAVKGIMLESNLVAGKQELRGDGGLEYGKSVTDECIDVDETNISLNTLAQSVTSRRTLSAIS